MAPALKNPLNDPAYVLRVADLSHRKDTHFNVDPLPQTAAAIKAELALDGLRKISLKGRIEPVGARDFRLRATIGATVVQPCVVTLEPVTTRIDAEVERFYVSAIDEPEAAEVEMPDDDTIEPLPDEINLVDVLAEALSLNLPAYPRHANADAAEAMVFTEPGKSPMQDEDTKPFAGLAALREQLDPKDD